MLLLPAFTSPAGEVKRHIFLLISQDHLQINVYVLGAVFLQLCQVLLLTEHPFIHNLVDPSFFIYRFTFYRTVPVVKSSPKSGEVPCKHKEDGGAEHFAHGLCEECYNEFIKLSGGLEGGSDLQLSNELKKQRLEAAEKATEDAATKEAALQSSCETHNSVVENNITTPTKNNWREAQLDNYFWGSYR